MKSQPPATSEWWPDREDRRLVWHAVLSFFFPYPCLACRVLDHSEDRELGLCSDCRRRVIPSPDPSCQGCGRSLATDRLCGRCLRSPPPYDRLSIAFEYLAPLTFSIRALKSSRLEYLGEPLAASLLRRHAASLIRCDVVTCIPLTLSRWLHRGYNQAEAIARPLAQHMGQPFRPMLQRRARPKQALLSRHRRLANLQEAFRCTEDLRGHRVLLVDDVITTGSTVAAASRSLLAAGARSVHVAAAARTPSWNEARGQQRGSPAPPSGASGPYLASQSPRT